jgi:hypothetical protein
VHKDRKDLRVQLVLRVLEVHKVHKVLQAQLDHKGFRVLKDHKEIQDRKEFKGHKELQVISQAFKEQPDLQVVLVHKVHKDLTEQLENKGLTIQEVEVHKGLKDHKVHKGTKELKVVVEAQDSKVLKVPKVIQEQLDLSERQV